MRRAEVAALKWSELDVKNKMVSVLRSHPRECKVLEVVSLLGDSWALSQRQPKVDDRIFRCIRRP